MIFSYITDFTTRHEKLYAQLDQLDDLLEPDEVEESIEEQVEMEVEVEEPEEELQGEPVKDVGVHVEGKLTIDHAQLLLNC